MAQNCATRNCRNLTDVVRAYEMQRAILTDAGQESHCHMVQDAGFFKGNKMYWHTVHREYDTVLRTVNEI